MSNSRPQISRRYMQPLPSRKKHVLLVTCFLTVIISYIIIITNVQGQASDARSIRSVAIAPPELPPASDTLEAQSEALPDLLAGDVLDNINIIIASYSPSNTPYSRGSIYKCWSPCHHN